MTCLIHQAKVSIGLPAIPVETGFLALGVWANDAASRNLDTSSCELGLVEIELLRSDFEWIGTEEAFLALAADDLEVIIRLTITGVFTELFIGIIVLLESVAQERDFPRMSFAWMLCLV